jgi:aminoglycoside 3-N-acetyltransferase I
MKYKIKRLKESDVNLFKELLLVFSQAFGDEVADTQDLPDDSYLTALLTKSDFYALVALSPEGVVGGLTGYELILPTKKKKELYLYDLAVDEKHRKQGIATSLVNELKMHARENNISLIFVEAESAGIEAIGFYRSLKAEQLSVEHFNIEVD